MKDFIFMFNKNDWKVTGFYPYTSCVVDRIFSQNFNYKTEEHDFLDQLWNHLWKEAESLGCKLDNKIVLQITKINKSNLCDSVLYLGRYDGSVHLGLSLYQDSWLKDSNKKFNQ